MFDVFAVSRVWNALAGGQLLARLANHQKTVTSLCVAASAGPSAAQHPRLISGSLDCHTKVMSPESPVLGCSNSRPQSVWHALDVNFVLDTIVDPFCNLHLTSSKSWLSLTTIEEQVFLISLILNLCREGECKQGILSCRQCMHQRVSCLKHAALLHFVLLITK